MSTATPNDSESVFEPDVSTPKPVLLHRLLREVLRNYTVFESLCSSTGKYDIEHKGININFLDLQKCLKAVSPRKKEAIFYNIIRDMKQKDVAAIMGITTVSVGQYCDSALLSVAQKLWPEEFSDS